MKQQLPSNTVTMACDAAYVWGVWLCIASMRRHGMNEPVVVCVNSWPERWEKAICKFDGVRIYRLSPEDKRNVCSSKALAMLQGTDTEYVSWVDCDAIFSGNCSEKLLPPDEDTVRMRPRSSKDTAEVMKRFYAEGETSGMPKAILERWQKDVNDRKEPRCVNPGTSGIITVHRKFRPFLELWHAQMIKILVDNKEVVDMHNPAYFMTDESVLNSLLFFRSDAPKICDTYGLNEDWNALYAHYSLSPKPWILWNAFQYRFYDMTMDTIDWALEHGFLPPDPLPFMLRRKNRFFAKAGTWISPFYARFQRLRKKIRKLFSA